MAEILRKRSNLHLLKKLKKLRNGNFSHEEHPEQPKKVERVDFDRPLIEDPCKIRK